MPLFRKNIISNQVIKTKSDKLMKRTMRDARKKIKKGELANSHDLALYLRTIDARYTYIKADINNASRVINYAKVRADKLAEARQILDFLSRDYVELDRLSQIVSKKAEQAHKIDDFKHQHLSVIDLTKLTNSLDALMHEEQ